MPGLWKKLQQRPSRESTTKTNRKRLPLVDGMRSSDDRPEPLPSTMQELELKPDELPLPTNVETILAAGSPECWSLSGSTTPTRCTFPNNQNNTEEQEMTNSRLSWSESNPSIATTLATQEEEEALSSSSRRSLAAYDHCDAVLASLRVRRRNSHARLQQALSTATQSPTPQQRKQPRHPSSMTIVMYSSPAMRPDPQQALQVWFHTAEALVKSKEMSCFVSSTCNVVLAATGLAVRTAFLPVTVPLHLVCATKDLVGWTCLEAVRHTGALLAGVSSSSSRQQQPLLQMEADSNTNGQPQQITESEQEEAVRVEQQQPPGNPVGALFHNVTHHVLPYVFQTAEKLKDEVGSTVVSLVMPPGPSKTKSQCPAKVNDRAALDKLRLPVFDSIHDSEPKKDANHCEPVVHQHHHHHVVVSRADFSKYLMRVEDLGIAAPADDESTTSSQQQQEEGSAAVIVLYIDLSVEFGDQVLLTQALDIMVTRALELATDHAPVIPPATNKNSTPVHVEWKPEGCTAKFLRKKTQQSDHRWHQTFSQETLIWSGQFQKHRGGSGFHEQWPLYLARGIVPHKSPRDFLELLWDNARTTEYNQYCSGRENLLVLDDHVLTDGAHTGTKVVKSETRVPYTGLTVTMLTVMHCRPLPGGPEEGYCIVSRSLVSGMAGYHTTSTKVQKNKSEILWGLNVFRRVPGHPDQTHLTSLSQVASGMVPHFLGHRIGIMGVLDFFRNARKHPNPKTATTTCRAETTSTTTTTGAAPKTTNIPSNGS